MNQKSAKEWAEAVKQALAAAGMPRTSEYSGGAVTGWTKAYGSTGFSLCLKSSGKIDWHVVISGKPLLKYREFKEHSDGEDYNRHEPLRPERLIPRIKTVFQELGLVVHEVTYTGHQDHWDDDVDYNILTDYPDGLEHPRIR